MGVLHVRRVIGGEGKQTRGQSQGMFLLHQLSGRHKVAWSCQLLLGSNTAPVSQEQVVEQVSRSSSPGPKRGGGSGLAFLCWSQQSLMGSSSGPDRDTRMGSREACMADLEQPSQDSGVSSLQDPRLRFTSSGTNSPALFSSPPVSRKVSALRSLWCSNTLVMRQSLSG